jgi:membrane associated rhomboid family serine protease
VIPLCDVIPQRTFPSFTIALIAASLLWAFLYPLMPAGVVVINVTALWLFGWTVEDRLGRDRFLPLFAVCSVTAWMLGDERALIPGGIGGVIGAYFALYPRSIMLVLAPVPMWLLELPAFVFLGLWLLLQALSGLILQAIAAVVVGTLLGLVLKRPERMRVEWWGP